MRDKPILQSIDNVLNFDVIVYVKDIVVVHDVVVQKVNKNLFVVPNPIDDIEIGSGSLVDIFANMPLLKSFHESGDLL